MGNFILTLLLFGMALINLCNLIGFMFTNVDNAFKNSIIVMALLGFAFPMANALLDVILMKIDPTKTAEKVLNWVCLILSPFNCLG